MNINRYSYQEIPRDLKALCWELGKRPNIYIFFISRYLIEDLASSRHSKFNWVKVYSKYLGTLPFPSQLAKLRH